MDMGAHRRVAGPAILIAVVVALATGAAAEQTMTAAGAVGFYAVQRTPTPIRVDGSLDELGWQLAEQINGFQRILHQYGRIERPTRAKMLWDDEALYVGFANTDPDAWAICASEDDPMWTEEVVEVFIDPDGDGQAYLELEVNPLNAWVDLLVHRALPRLAADADWDIAGLRTAVQVHGSVNDSLAADTGWTVEIAIPWAAMEGAIGGGGRPRPGDEWRLNLYRIERTGGRRLKQQIDALQAETKPLLDQVEARLSTSSGAHRDETALTRKQRQELTRLRERLKPLVARAEPLQKLYEDGTEYTAWSPTWRQGFHDPSRFGVVRFVE